MSQPQRIGVLRKLVIEPHFAIGMPFVRRPEVDTKVMPEDKLRYLAQRTTDISELRAAFKLAPTSNNLN